MGGSTSQQVGSSLGASSSGGSSSGTPAPATVELFFPQRDVVRGQTNFQMKVVVNNTSGSDIFLDPNPQLRVRATTGGALQTGYALVINPNGRAQLAAGSRTQFFVPMDVQTNATFPADRQVRVEVDLPWSLTASGSLEPGFLTGVGAQVLTVVDLPVVVSPSINPLVGPNNGVGQCPQVCFTLQQGQSRLVDVLVESTSNGVVRRATQVSGAFDRRSAGTRGLPPGTQHCFTWNAPADLGRRTGAVGATLTVTPTLHGVPGTPSTAGTLSIPEALMQCGADFRAPLAFVPQRDTTALLPADLDRDGQPDFIVATSGGTVTQVNLFRGLGGGATEPSGPNLQLGSITAMAVGAFAGDPLPDLVTAERGNIRVLQNNSAGGTLSFAETWTHATSTMAADRVAAADLDGNGASEVLFTFPGLGELGVLLRVGSTTTPLTHAPNVDVRDFDVADLDQDGVVDVVMVTQQLNATTRMPVGPSRLQWLRGGPGAVMNNATFEDITVPAGGLGCNPDAVRVGDVNPPASPSASIPDLVVLCEAAGSVRQVMVVTQNESGVFSSNIVHSVTVGSTSGPARSMTLGEFDGTPGVDLLLSLDATPAVNAQLVTLEPAGTAAQFGPPVVVNGAALDANHDGMDDVFGMVPAGNGIGKALLWRRMAGTHDGSTRQAAVSPLPDRLFSIKTGPTDALLGFDAASGLRLWATPNTSGTTLGLPQSGQTIRDITPGSFLTGPSKFAAGTTNGTASFVHAFDVVSGSLTTAATANLSSDPLVRLAGGVHYSTFQDVVTLAGGRMQATVSNGSQLTALATICNPATAVQDMVIGKVGGLAVTATIQSPTGNPPSDVLFYRTITSGVDCTAVLNRAAPGTPRNPRQLTFANTEVAFVHDTATAGVRQVTVQFLRDSSGALALDGAELNLWNGPSSNVTLGSHAFGQDPDRDLIIHADGAVEVWRRLNSPSGYTRTITVHSFGGAASRPGPRMGDFDGDGIEDLLWISNENGADYFRVAPGF